jgi:tetratricopeptide (TPR) repeat protein
VTLLGDIYRGNKDYAAAIEAYSQAIENSENGDDNLWALYYARGTAFERAQLWSSAEADLKKSLQLSPDQPYVLNYLAYSWVDRNINLQDAKKMLIRAVELAPQDAFIIDSLGWLHYKMGSYDDAENLLQLAVEIRPYDPQLIDHYGDVLWQLNRREQATIQWKRAMSFGPDEDLKKSLEAKIKGGLHPPSGESKPQGQAMDSGQQH